MIKANEARAQSLENKAKNAYKDVEVNIRKAMAKGKCETTFLCAYDLIEPITEFLNQFGYKVSSVQGGIKIYWG